MAAPDSDFQHPDIERLDRDDILALQAGKLAALGRRLNGDPDWTAHFAKAGMKPGDLADPRALGQAPTLEKADLRALYPFPMLSVDQAAVVRFCATTGTTGPPVLFGLTGRDVNALLAGQMMRIFRTIGLRPGDRVYQGFASGTWMGGLAMNTGLAAYGATNLFVGPGRGELAVRWLKDLGHTAIFTSLLWLNRLAVIAHEQGIDPKRDWRLRVGLYGGQSMSKELQDATEAIVTDGFRTHDIYGTTEAGGPVVSAPCAHAHDRDQMHLINEDTVLTEILDPETLAPVGPGEVGEIVITTLDKEASPVIRWRTHDLVRLAEQPYDCPCGRRGLPLIGRIIGRSDDMLKIRGVIVFPSQVEEIVAGTQGTVKEAWQIYVARDGHALEEATVAIERSRDAKVSAESLGASVAEALKARLGLRLTVECHEEGVLPRYESKAQRVLVRGKAE